MRRQQFLAVAAAAVVCATGAGCSSSGTGAHSTSTTTATPRTPLTMSARHVTGVVDRYLRRLRTALATEHENCGGAASVTQTDPAAARRCEKSLRDISDGAQELASALALMRPPEELTTRVADTTDAARTIQVVYRAYSTSECLPSPLPGTPARARCDTAGREFGTLIAALVTQLDRWRP